MALGDQNVILESPVLTPATTSVEPEVCTCDAGPAVKMPRTGDDRGFTKTGEVENPTFHSNESEKLPSEISFRNGN